MKNDKLFEFKINKQMKKSKWKKEKEIYEGNKSIVYTIDLKNRSCGTVVSIFLNELPNAKSPKKTKTEVEIVLWIDEDSDAITILKTKLFGNIETVDMQYIASLKTNALGLAANRIMDIADKIIGENEMSYDMPDYHRSGYKFTDKS